MSDARDSLPISLLASSLEGAFLAAEVMPVMALRLLSMSGFRPMAATEPFRMFLEKPPAFAASGVAAWVSAARGERADQVLAASLRPLRLEARANAERLRRSGAAVPANLPRPIP